MKTYHYHDDCLRFMLDFTFLSCLNLPDTIVHSGNCIYIFELKINKKPEDALQQIMSKKYYEAFTIYNKQIELVGLSFIISEHSFVIEYAVAAKR